MDEDYYQILFLIASSFQDEIAIQLNGMGFIEKANYLKTFRYNDECSIDARLNNGHSKLGVKEV